MSNKRGALIVFEGCNQAEMSMRAKTLTNMLNTQGIRTKNMCYPSNNKHCLRGLLKEHGLPENLYVPQLTKVMDEIAYAIYLRVFMKAIEKKLLSGVTLIINKYTATGVAYISAINNIRLNSYQSHSVGLIKPDCVMFLKTSNWQQMLGSNWGFWINEIKRDGFPKRLIANFEKLRDENWFTFDMDQDESKSVQDEILQKAQLIINKIEHSKIERIRGRSAFKIKIHNIKRINNKST